MLKRPKILDSQLEFESSDSDSYTSELPDGETFSDAVLDFLSAVMRESSSSSLIDVGANIGVHSIGLARSVPGLDVLAIEANPVTARSLEANVRRNAADNVRVLERAVSDAPGSIKFGDNRTFAAGSMSLDGAAAEFATILEARSADDFEVIEVTCSRVDDLVDELGLTTVTHLKIDIEGHDLRAVRGARATIDQFLPVVIMEFATLAITLHAGMLPADVLREVREQFQDVYVLQEGGWLHEIVDDEGAIGFLEGNAVEWPVQDLVCVPGGSPHAAVVRSRVTTRPPRSRADHIWDLKQELTSARDEAARLGVQVSELSLRADEAGSAASTLAAMEQTLSWRVTRPLRAVRARLPR